MLPEQYMTNDSYALMYIGKDRTQNLKVFESIKEQKTFYRIGTMYVDVTKYKANHQREVIK